MAGGEGAAGNPLGFSVPRLRGAVRVLRGLWGSAARDRDQASRRQQVWSIGLYEGPSLFALQPSGAAANPILSRDDVHDVDARFVADPFVLRVRETWHMFFEVFNRTTGKGEIGLAVSATGHKWDYQSIVLSEPFHLSYPYVFEWDGQYFMIPECGVTRSIRLYAATDFPFQWRPVSTMLDGRPFWDASIIRWEGRWWLFAETSAEEKSDTLRLYHAESLHARWTEHPRSPIVNGNPHIARPAGRLTVDDGCVVRFGQDCSPRYGIGVRAFRITALTPATYAEELLRESPIIEATGAGWNALGMHHIDLHVVGAGRSLAFVDGRMDVEE